MNLIGGRGSHSRVTFLLGAMDMEPGQFKICIIGVLAHSFIFAQICIGNFKRIRAPFGDEFPKGAPQSHYMLSFTKYAYSYVHLHGLCPHAH